MVRERNVPQKSLTFKKGIGDGKNGWNLQRERISVKNRQRDVPRKKIKGREIGEEDLR